MRSGFRETCRMLNIELDIWQEWACEFLEARGLRFGIDFGYENAETTAERIQQTWWVM